MAYCGRKVLAVVPARGGSKGIHRKNLLHIGGISLVARAARIACQLPWVDYAIISTDDDEIREEGMRHGLDSPFIRPMSLANDNSGPLELWQHAHLESEKHQNIRFDCTILLEPTSPFRTLKHIEDTIARLVDGRFDSVITVTKTDSKSHPLKQLVMDGDRVKHYDEKGSQVVTRQELSSLYHRNGVAYAVTRECLLEKNTIIGLNSAALVIEEPMINIDTMWDVRVANWLWSDSQEPNKD